MGKSNFSAQLTLFFIFLWYTTVFSSEIPILDSFRKEDRILILAPHPDDEAIATSGVIQRALQVGAKMKVVLFTNGDNNELAFIVYEKRLTFRKNEFLHMGEVRKKESLRAMQSLGLSQDDIICLGYPDFGTLQILTRYWGQVRSYRSMFPRQNKVSYPDAMSPGAPYVGESILKDLKRIIIDFKPTKIFVSHPADHNRDHQALYLFLRLALWDTEGQISSPEIFPYLIHMVGWPKPRGFHPEIELLPPQELVNSKISWQRLVLTDAELKNKHEAILFYKSQNKCDPPYLLTFARKNENFGDCPIVKIKFQANQEIDWQDIETNEEGRVSVLAYAHQAGNLLIRLELKKKINKVFGVSVYLLGYKKKIDFSLMPKIRMDVDIAGLHVHDKKQTLFMKDIRLAYKNKDMIFTIPLKSLGNPDYIFSYVRTSSNTLPLDETCWRILELE